MGTYVQSVHSEASEAELFRRRTTLMEFPQTWTADGSLIFAEVNPTTGINAFSIDSKGTITRVLDSPANENRPRVSPNLKWLAYDSDESGQGPNIYIRRYPKGRPVPVSRNGGTEPRWAGAGELIYRRGAEVVSVRIADAGGESPDVSNETVLFKIDDHPWHYDVSPDGTKFLFLRRLTEVREQGTDQVHLLPDLFGELNRRLP